MEVVQDSSFTGLDPERQQTCCQDCQRKDKMIERYVKLVDLQKQKIRKRQCGIRSATGNGWFSARKKQLRDSTQFSRTADTCQTWKFSMNLTSVNMGQANIQSAMAESKEITSQLLKKSQLLVGNLTDSLFELKSKLLLIRSSVYHLFRHLDIQHNSKMDGDLNLKRLADVMMNIFEFSVEERVSMFASKERADNWKRLSFFSLFFG